MSEIESQYEEGIQSNICLMLKEILARENLNDSVLSSSDEEEPTNVFECSKEISDEIDSSFSDKKFKKQKTELNLKSNSNDVFFSRKNNKENSKKLHTYIDKATYKHFNNYFNQQNTTEVNSSSFEKSYPLTQNQKNISSNYITNFVKPPQPNETSQYYNQTYISHLEFLLGKTKRIDKFVYSQISGNIKSIVSNSKGCKILQNYLHGTNISIINLIFQEIKDSIIPLTTSSYSHHFLLRLYECISLPEKMSFLKILSNHFLLLSTHNVSTYFIQNIIDKLNSQEEQILIIKTINPIKSELSFDKYGTYVIEKIISFFDYSLLDELLQFIVNNFVLLACHCHGLCIIKKVIAIESSFAETKYHNSIKQIMIENSLNLIQNPYGNYAIQIAIDKWNDGSEIAQCFDNNIIFLSLQKYSSNVIERCFEKNHNVLIKFIYYLHLYGQTNDIVKMLNNTFGNFVLMKAIKLCSTLNEFELLRKIILNGLSKLNDKKLNIKWSKFLFSY